ncbi:pectinesterase [Amborella trichopoda]|nr:pectinesterase [Amborella trichopoda]|eukprot:XP_006838619.2 pectinesterase [Amborella trichopoda]
MVNTMAHHLVLWLLTIAMVSITVEGTMANVKRWCIRTPHPESCTQLMGQSPSPKSKANLHHMVVKAAMDRALQAQADNLKHSKSCTNKLERVAWSDCFELYKATIVHLNRTLRSPTRTELDTQTWLSASLTNLETCTNGFIDLDVQAQIPAKLAKNVSQLICNALAINKPPSSNGPKTRLNGRFLHDRFPGWVSVGDQRFLQAKTLASQANLKVAADGSGNYKTIREALRVASNQISGTQRFIIHVKAGVYNENVQITNSMKNLMFVGDGKGNTIITASRSVRGGSTTFSSATFAVSGDRFMARDMTFRNTAGPENHQAVALRVSSDFAAFYRCSIDGYQDTLHADTLRQFYRECDIYGTVDFIFGNAIAVFQNCNIFVRRPMSQQKNTITAQGRSDPNQNTGISIHNSRISAAPDLSPVQGSFATYLGRPWQKHARTIFLKCFLDDLINPAGWLEWSENFALSTLYYGEYRNTGPGSNTGKRVKWNGYHFITSPSEASKFSVGSFLDGGSWIPATGVPFTLDL